MASGLTSRFTAMVTVRVCANVHVENLSYFNDYCSLSIYRDGRIHSLYGIENNYADDIV